MNPLIFASREKYILWTMPFMFFYLDVDFFPF